MSDSPRDKVKANPSRCGIDTCVNGLRFRSDFCSGNLKGVELVDGGNALHYRLWTWRDAHGTPGENTNRTWFHFSVEGASQGCELTLTVMNLNKQRYLYEAGMTPVVKESPGDEDFRRTRGKVSWEFVEEDFQLTFHYTPLRTGSTLVFAFCIPYSFEECQRDIASLVSRLANSTTIDCTRSTLCHSLEGRPVDLLTISSAAPSTDDTPPASSSSSPTPDKPIFFCSARVHPGEVVSSHMMNGLLAFLTDESDPRAVALREHFTFHLVPMLNPDGVARGHYRSDSLGANLNRFYASPINARLHPIQSAVMAHLRAHSARLRFYVDLHGHANRRGCFIFGNALPRQSSNLQTDNVAYAQLVALNNPHFTFNNCNFAAKSMSSRDKREGLSKEGSGRVAVYRALNLTHSYTVECNYHSAKVLSPVAPVRLADDPHARASPPTDAGTPPPPFTRPILHSLGRDLAIAALDLCAVNPWSRLPASSFGSLEAVRRACAVLARSSAQFGAPEYASVVGSASSQRLPPRQEQQSTSVSSIATPTHPRHQLSSKPKASPTLTARPTRTSLLRAQRQRERYAHIHPSSAPISPPPSLPPTTTTTTATPTEPQHSDPTPVLRESPPPLLPSSSDLPLCITGFSPPHKSSVNE